MDKARPWSFYERHVSGPRLAHYLAACDGRQYQAVILYEWNATLASTFWESLGHVEVALRNAIDRRLAQRHRRRLRSSLWVFDDARELGRDARGHGRHNHPYLEIQEAQKRVRRNHKRVDGNQIVSELPFGFWHQMLSKQQTFLWPDLAAAFPGAPDRARATVHDRVARLRTIRNRIGHHHRIWSADVAARYDDLTDLAGYLDPDLKGYIEASSGVPTLLERYPLKR